MSDLEKITPTIPSDMWIEQPAVANDRAQTTAQDAENYTTELAVAGGLLATLVANVVVRSAAGPYAGLLDLALAIFKKPTPPTPPAETPPTMKEPPSYHPYTMKEHG